MESIPQTYQVRPIDYDECKEWCLYKHYAHRMPSISYSFGLYDNNLTLQGIITFGMPAANTLVRGAFNGQFMDTFLELNRLCVNEGLPRNTLSFLVSQSLKMLPKPMAIVSYADSEQNHHGYIYQATNWIYTGMSAKGLDWKVKGMENKHNRHLVEDKTEGETKSRHERLAELYGEENLYQKERSQKYRYFYFLGSKTQRRKMMEALAYPIQPYPKGDNIRYDASHSCETQGLLF